MITGIKLTKSNSLTTRVGFQYSLKSSLSVSKGIFSAGTESTATYSAQIEASTSSSEERSWSKSIKKTFTVPAGKRFRVVQKVFNFESRLDIDNCTLYCEEKVIEES